LALDLAMQSRLDEAAAAYAATVQAASACDHPMLAEYHVQHGQALHAVGDLPAARRAFDQALAVALQRSGGDEASFSVAITRYFAAEFLVASGRSAEALVILAPALANAPRLEAILRMIEAEALQDLGQTGDARRAAARAVACASSEEQRERIEARLRERPHLLAEAVAQTFARDDPPDPTLTPEQEAVAASLSPELVARIDATLLSHARPYNRKVAFVVAGTMMDPALRVPGLPDVFYAQRVRLLVARGLLVAEGDLRFMRYSEVRLA
jgi:tetratricopeptide (TPR) repeat protein